MIAVFIPGNPAPQGSKRHVGGGRMIEMCKRVKPWRTDIRAHLLDDSGRPKATFNGAVHIDVEFVMPRPKSAPKRSEPLAIKRPDVDKLLRSLLDAISSAHVWNDDSQVVSISAEKRIARIGETPGCHLHITCAIERAKKEEREAA